MKHVQWLLLAFMMVVSPHADAIAQHAGNHSKHLAEVNERGDEVMGFSHSKTTHHFRLIEDGGRIEVEANEASDVESKEQIRQHLKEIAEAFAEGRFDAPRKIHGQTPPGVELMEEMKESINYQFEPTESGGRVRITTSDPGALQAVHEFLRFQIQDHQTGDHLDVMTE